MPVSILLKAIGLTPEQILATFYEFDTFQLSKKGPQFNVVPERLRGETAKFDIVTKDGKVIVAKDKRITAKHIRDLAERGLRGLLCQMISLSGVLSRKTLSILRPGKFWQLPMTN